MYFAKIRKFLKRSSSAIILVTGLNIKACAEIICNLQTVNYILTPHQHTQNKVHQEMSKKEKEYRRNEARYANLVIKTSIEIDMDQEKWTLPCVRRLKKYVIRDKRYIKEKYKEFNNLEELFDDVDKILSVSEFCSSFQVNLLSGHCHLTSPWLVCLLCSPNFWISLFPLLFFSGHCWRLKGISGCLCICQCSIICSRIPAQMLL